MIDGELTGRLSSEGGLQGSLSAERTLNGILSCIESLRGSLSSVGELTGSLTLADCGFTYYMGDYVVDPDFTGVVLPTADKMMLQDVEVKPIRVERVSNPAGGITVYIGGVNG